MVITNISIRAYKSIYDLTLPLDPKVNVMIGANESGKTNILRALESFRPDRPFDSSLTCQYSNHYYMGKCPEITLELGNITKENRRNLLTVSEAFKDIETFELKRDGPALNNYHLRIMDKEINSADIKRLLRTIPNIVYFDEIPLIKNKIDQESLISDSNQFITEKNLLKIGGIEDYEILFEDSTRGRRSTEEASRMITEQIRRVWSQEPSIEIKLNVNGKVLYIDILDSTTVFDTPDSRSLGFRWYLSFYVNFITQTFEGRANEFIFLIDEPGIHLHPAGQKDLVKVMEDLSIKNQVLYTTHSPFMINRSHPERVMLVTKDKEGTKMDNQSYRQNWKPLRSSIGLTVGDMLFFNESGIEMEMSAKKSLANRLKIWSKD